MRLLTTILTSLSICCYSQGTYEQRLSTRVNEIKKLSYYNNSFVVYSESSGYGTNFPFWKSTDNFYEGDFALDKSGKMYQALVDSKGKEPSISKNEWNLIPYDHPYLFLRDTAKVEDLKKLLKNKHPYVRTYAFGALASMKEDDGLYNVLLDNLSDTTQIDQMTGDYGYYVCPADLMISYLADRLTPDQKKYLQKLIETKFLHIKDAWRWIQQ